MKTGTDIAGLRPISKKNREIQHTIQILVRQREELDTRIKELWSLLPKERRKKSVVSQVKDSNGKTYKLR